MVCNAEFINVGKKYQEEIKPDFEKLKLLDYKNGNNFISYALGMMISDLTNKHPHLDPDFNSSFVDTILDINREHLVKKVMPEGHEYMYKDSSKYDFELDIREVYINLTTKYKANQILHQTYNELTTGKLNYYSLFNIENY